jgi:hypothetical protein
VQPEKTREARSDNRASVNSKTLDDAHSVAPQTKEAPLRAEPEICELLDWLREEEKRWFKEHPGQMLERPYCPGEMWPFMPTLPGPGFKLVVHVSEIGPGVRAREYVPVVDTNNPALRWVQ